MSFSFHKYFFVFSSFFSFHKFMLSTNYSFPVGNFSLLGFQYADTVFN